MKLKDLLLEGKKIKTLGKNKNVMEMIKSLRENPGGSVIERIQNGLNEAGAQVDMSKLYEKIASKYKKLDNEVANMLEGAINEADKNMVDDRHEKLETIKKRAEDIQLSLKKEIAKPTKRKK